MVQDNAVGLSVYSGPGAGGLPTAASVVADLIRVAQGSLPAIAQPKAALKAVRLKSLDETEAAFYLRIPVLDKPGVLAGISNLLGQQGISIESLIQREQAVRDSQVPVVVLTQRVPQSALNRALIALADSSDVVGEIVHLRVESLL